MLYQSSMDDAEDVEVEPSEHFVVTNHAQLNGYSWSSVLCPARLRSKLCPLDMIALVIYLHCTYIVC